MNIWVLQIAKTFFCVRQILLWRMSNRCRPKTIQARIAPGLSWCLLDIFKSKEISRTALKFVKGVCYITPSHSKFSIVEVFMKPQLVVRIYMNTFKMHTIYYARTCHDACSIFFRWAMLKTPGLVAMHFKSLQAPDKSYECLRSLSMLPVVLWVLYMFFNVRSTCCNACLSSTRCRSCAKMHTRWLQVGFF